jgi:hypothetical protein
MSTKLQFGEFLCAHCGQPLNSVLECTNGHPLFSDQSAASEIEQQILRDRLFTDPLEIREIAYSAASETFDGVECTRVNSRYDTITTKTPLHITKRAFLAGAAKTGSMLLDKLLMPTAAGVVGGILVASHQSREDINITEDELRLFREYEHDRASLRRLQLGLGETRLSLRRLIGLQIGILDGSDLADAGAEAKSLAETQTGIAKARTFTQFVKILHLTGRPFEAAKQISDALHLSWTNEELYDLYFQLLASNVAALDQYDITQAPNEFSGTVKSLAATTDAAFELLFPSMRPSERRGALEECTKALALGGGISNLKARELGMQAAQATVYLNIMRNHKSDSLSNEAETAIRIAEAYGEVAPRHGWNVLNVVAGLYWHLGSLDRALMLSDKANSYLLDRGDRRMQLYAKDQRAQNGTEYLIFATTRARLLFEKAFQDRINAQSLLGECERLLPQLTRANNNLSRLSRIEKARQYAIGDITLNAQRDRKGLRRIAYGEVIPMASSHLLYAAMPPRAAGLDRIRPHVQ